MKKISSRHANMVAVWSMNNIMAFSVGI